MFFVLYGGLYSMGRFFLSFLRVEQISYFNILNQAQILALIVIVVAIPLLVFKAQIVRPVQSPEAGRPRSRRAR
jgi:prolipoprotein diacylglyceryltransferase